MRHSTILVAPLAMFALATAVLAGGPDCEKHAKNAAYAASNKEGCSATKEECLKHMQEAKNNGWLGIKYDSTEDGTSVIESVVKGSPAEKAGFRSGDVLVALNGIEINEANKTQRQDRMEVAQARLDGQLHREARRHGQGPHRDPRQDARGRLSGDGDRAHERARGRRRQELTSCSRPRAAVRRRMPGGRLGFWSGIPSD